MAKYETHISDYDRRERKMQSKWWTTPPVRWPNINKQERIPMPDQSNPSEWAMAQARSLWPANLKSVARLLDAAGAERDEALRLFAEREAAYIRKGVARARESSDSYHAAVDRFYDAGKALNANPIAKQAIAERGKNT